MRLAGQVLELLLGHALMALGIATSTASDLGTTPVSSLPLVGSLISGLSLGATTILVNVTLLALQALILRRDFRPVQLLQLICLVWFGPFIDAAVWSLDRLGVGYTAYWQQWALTLAGIVLVGVGVAFQVHARLLVLPGDGFSQALTFALQRRFGPSPRFEFGRVKVLADTGQVLISLVLALVFLGGFVGVREGTLAAAFGVGWVVTWVMRVLPPTQAR
ncbi:YczE/YyaS/YitT family protein [Corynebacterium guangdongense]|uniref:Membrane protein YczE n=1 Tax=Corynebacterium guangdongense TaxID=1783348 RepID=A0ABU2A0W5_9CORY|nr:DUF6198 family protein [Corynebacterium guangdongense]MDR7330832.1 putative membrane protein YczE [Corynebacterium guangdongense]WJZ16847.1 hypothetical protein CGUA_01230 [Corynebacterium guangdongense]